MDKFKSFMIMARFSWLDMIGIWFLGAALRGLLQGDGRTFIVGMLFSSIVLIVVLRWEAGKSFVWRKSKLKPGESIGRIISSEMTDEGLIVTGEITSDKIQADKITSGYISYCAADAEMTMALYGVHPEMEDPLKPARGCLWGLAIAIPLWIFSYWLLCWLLLPGWNVFDIPTP